MAKCVSVPESLNDTLDSSFGGYNCSFVEEPSQSLFCLICTRVLREPELTDCCGNHYCSSCLQKWLKSTRSCPLCRERRFHTLRDKKTERLVHELKVKCRNRPAGCDWTGELGNLKAHLRQDCLYVFVECTSGCGDVLMRGDLEKHCLELCYLRIVECEYCGHQGTYEFIVDEHYDTCPAIPIACPNVCSSEMTIPRAELAAHVAVCPQEPVECEFNMLGCETMVAREFLGPHLSTSTEHHLSLVASAVSGFKQSLLTCRTEMDQLRGEIGEMKTKQKSLKQLVQELPKNQPSPLALPAPSLGQEPLTYMEKHLMSEARVFSSDPILPVVIKMEGFESCKQSRKPWYSKPFYTSAFGYKLCLCVYANGCCSGAGTHLSVFVHLMQGEFDATLVWPFADEITVSLQNHLSNSHHCAVNCSFTADLPSHICQRVSGASCARRGSGTPTFISLSSLQSGSSRRHCCYLKNNSLYFSVY